MDSPGGDSPYHGNRMAADSRSDRDRMDIDPPAIGQADPRRYPAVDPRYPQDNRPYNGDGRDPRDPRAQPDGRQYVPDPRESRDPRHRDPRDQRDLRDLRADQRSEPIRIDARYPLDGRQQYPQDQPLVGSYPRQPVTSGFQQDTRYATAYPQTPGDVVPPGYVRQGNYYVPVSQPPYDNNPAMRAEPQYPPYGGQQPAPGRSDLRDMRDSRDTRNDPRGDPRDPRDPRYPPDYQDPRDPRYAYPSPAATVSTISGERPQVTSPPSVGRCGQVDAMFTMDSANTHSPFAPTPSNQYDQYGRRKYI